MGEREDEEEDDSLDILALVAAAGSKHHCCTSVAWERQCIMARRNSSGKPAHETLPREAPPSNAESRFTNVQTDVLTRAGIQEGRLCLAGRLPLRLGKTLGLPFAQRKLFLQQQESRRV